MESRDLVSVSRQDRDLETSPRWDKSRDPFLRVSVSKVSGLETLNIAKKWFVKISIIQRFVFVVYASKKQQKHVGKNARDLKKIQVRSDEDIFMKISAKCTNFEVSVWTFKSRVLEFLRKSRSRLEILTGLGCYGLDYITVSHLHLVSHFCDVWRRWSENTS